MIAAGLFHRSLHRPRGYSDPDFLMEILVQGKLEGDDCPTLPPFSPAAATAAHGSGSEQGAAAAGAGARYAAPFTVQVQVLTERQWCMLWRGDTFSAQSLCQNSGLAALAGMLWFQLGTTEGDIFLRTALCLWIVGTWTFFPMFAATATFVEHAVNLRKELSVGAYSLGAFYIARTVTAVPIDFAWPSFYVTIVYWMTVPNALFSAYLSILGATLLTVVVMQSVGQLISAAVPKEQMVTVSVIVITYFFGYSGLFAPEMPSWLSWAKGANLLAYAYHLMLRSVFTDTSSFSCAAFGSEYSVCPPGPIRSSDVLQKHGVDNSASFCVAVLVSAMLLMKLLAYRILRHTYTQQEAAEYGLVL